MNPKIPVELAQARETRDIIWSDYAKAIEEGRSKDIIKLLGDTGEKMDELCTEWYNRWQAVGGTSDVVSIVDAEERKRQADGIAKDAEWMDEAAAEHADWLDNQRTMEESRY